MARQPCIAFNYMLNWNQEERAHRLRRIHDCCGRRRIGVLQRWRRLDRATSALLGGASETLDIPHVTLVVLLETARVARVRTWKRDAFWWFSGWEGEGGGRERKRERERDRDKHNTNTTQFLTCPLLPFKTKPGDFRVMLLCSLYICSCRLPSPSLYVISPSHSV